MRIKPRGQYILVRQNKEDSRESANGIITPENVEQEQKAVGMVLSVGEKIEDIKKGDTVVYGAFAGERIETKNGSREETLILLHTDDILAFVT